MTGKARISLLLLALICAASLVLAHPHFNKTITAKLPGGADVTIAYNTTPANEEHTTKAAVGSFLTPRRPTLKLSAEVKAGSVTIPAGDYTIGVVKNSADDWTMALFPGQVPRGQTPDASKLIKLESMYSNAEGKAPHMLIDISPGHGKFEGRAVLTIHFGSLFLAGALS
jgi:hypothetical protein